MFTLCKKFQLRSFGAQTTRLRMTTHLLFMHEQTTLWLSRQLSTRRY